MILKLLLLSFLICPLLAESNSETNTQDLIKKLQNYTDQLRTVSGSESGDDFDEIDDEDSMDDEEEEDEESTGVEEKKFNYKKMVLDEATSFSSCLLLITKLFGDKLATEISQMAEEIAKVKDLPMSTKQEAKQGADKLYQTCEKNLDAGLKRLEEQSQRSVYLVRVLARNMRHSAENLVLALDDNGKDIFEQLRRISSRFLYERNRVYKLLEDYYREPSHETVDSTKLTSKLEENIQKIQGEFGKGTDEPLYLASNLTTLLKEEVSSSAQQDKVSKFLAKFMLDCTQSVFEMLQESGISLTPSTMDFEDEE